MKRIEQYTLLGVTYLGLAACASVPSTDELQRMNGEELQTAVSGNTVTARTDYGRYAELYETENSTAAKIWGSWGSQNATGNYTISGDGEVCTIYSGPHDWTTPDHQYCSVFYTDEQGNVFEEITKNSNTPEKEGKVRAAEIKPGDAYGLNE